MIFMKRIFIFSAFGFLFFTAHAPTLQAQILASPVFDVANNLIGGIQKAVMIASKAIREEILPLKESIAKVQDFFKKSSQVVNSLIRNLKMTHDLIQIEQDIFQLFQRSMAQIDAAPNVQQKWKHRWILGQLYWESRNVFGVFELSYKENYAIMDDEGRIRFIQSALKQARTIYRAMKLTIRRTNRETYQFNRQKKELALFLEVFKR